MGKERNMVLLQRLDPEWETSQGPWEGRAVYVARTPQQAEALQAGPMGERCRVLTLPVYDQSTRWLHRGFKTILEDYPDAEGVVIADGISGDFSGFVGQMEKDTVLVGVTEDPHPMDGIAKLLFGVEADVLHSRLFGISLEVAREYLAEKRTGGAVMKLLKAASEAGKQVKTRTMDPSIVEEDKLTVPRIFRFAMHYYRQQILFCLSSFTTFMLELLIFSVLTGTFERIGFGALSIAAATLVGRVVSAIANYLLNRKLVFCRRRQPGGSGVKFAALNIVQMLMSAGLVTLADMLLPLPETVSKMIVDSILFFISFYVQKFWIFR